MTTPDPALLRAAITAARKTTCGTCYAPPGEPCRDFPGASPLGAGRAEGYHVGRMRRAHREGLLTRDVLDAVAGDMLPDAVIWDTGRGCEP